MSTKQQTTEQTIPAGFTHRIEEDDCIPGVYYDTWDGPRAGRPRCRSKRPGCSRPPRCGG